MQSDLKKKKRVPALGVHGLVAETGSKLDVSVTSIKDCISLQASLPMTSLSPLRLGH